MPRSLTPDRLILLLLLILIVGVAGLMLSRQQTVVSIPVKAHPPGGYYLATISQLRAKAPDTYWVGPSINGNALTLPVLGKPATPAQSALFYGPLDSSTSLAIFLFRPREAQRIRNLVKRCQEGDCVAGWRIQRFSGGTAMIRRVSRFWFARVVIGRSVLYLNCDLDGVNVEQVLPVLSPIGSFHS